MPSDPNAPRVTIILPALNEAASLETLLPQVEQELSNVPHEILVVDDGSSDTTSEVALRCGARVLRHPYTKGNGAAVKRGIREARGERILLMDADGQHDPRDLPRLLQAADEHDMAVGTRTRGSLQQPHRWAANRLFSWIASYLAGERIPDLTSGFRVLRADLAKRYVDMLPNTFSYPSTLTVLLAKAGYTIAHVPIVALPRRSKSKVRPLRDGLRFLQILLKVGVSLSPFRLFFPLSLFFLLAGVGWYAYNLVQYHRFTNMSVFLLCTSVILFMLGLTAEGIAQLRRERRDE